MNVSPEPDTPLHSSPGTTAGEQPSNQQVATPREWSLAAALMRLLLGFALEGKDQLGSRLREWDRASASASAPTGTATAPDLRRYTTLGMLMEAQERAGALVQALWDVSDEMAARLGGGASFLLQRARWAKGNLAVFRTRENPITCPGLTPRQRASYFASLYNYFAGLQRVTLLLVLTWVLFTGRLPMHASPLTLMTLWLPWTVLALTSTIALGRGSLGAFDSTRFGIMTAGIYIGGVLSLFSRRTGKFRVTPKEGVDAGGLPVLRMLGLMTVIAGLLVVAWSLRVAAWAGIVTLGSMPSFATAITVGLGGWEIGCLAGVIVPLVRRRRYRVQYRMPTMLQARIDRTSTIVPVLDLTPGGVSFESPIELTTRVVLLTRLPDAHGEIHDLTLPAEVRWCSPSTDGTHFRVGARFDHLDDAVRDLLVEYCFVVQPARQLGAQLEPAEPQRARRVS